MTILKNLVMEIIIETFRNPGEPSSRPIRVRPVPGQFKENYRVWCSVAMRKAKPIGSLFRVHVSFVHQQKGGTYLRIGLSAPWIPVTVNEVKRFFLEQHGQD